MKLTASIIKSWKENIREWKVITMVLLFSPFFILLMYLYYGGNAVTTYQVGLINNDTGESSTALIKSMEELKGQDGTKLLKITKMDIQEEMNLQVKEKTIDIGISIPKGYSEKLSRFNNDNQDTAIVDFYGSTGNTKYMVAAVLAGNLVYNQGMEYTSIMVPAAMKETFLEKKQALNEFENMAPGLISLSVLMILFSAAASIVKENDKKTLIRMKLSKMSAFHFLTGVSIVQAGIAVIAIVLSYWTALLFGYKPAGSFGPVLVVGILASFSMVAISLVVASFLNTVFDVLTVGCFPFFILMFFSGCMFPLPKMSLFTIAGHSFGVTDILPLTHMANAFNKIMNYGSGVSDVVFEMIMIMVLSVIYFILGVLLYQKRKLSKA